MRKFLARAIQAAGIYRLAEVAFSIWSGKSLLALAVLACGPAIIAAIARQSSWGDVDKIVLMGAAIYALLAFGWVATIIAYRKVSPKHKLVIPSFTFLCDIVPDSNPREASTFQAAFTLLNIADFPISYIVEDMDFRIQNTISDGQFPHPGAMIDAGQTGSFRSGKIAFHHPLRLPAEGTFKVKLRYGKPGSERFTRNASILIKYLPDEKMASGVRYSWIYDAGQNRPNVSVSPHQTKE